MSRTSAGGSMRVCVVGGGAAGLCAARHLVPAIGERRLLSATNKCSLVVYEQSDCVGGTWVYNEARGFDPATGLRVHSSMYEKMRTNLPKEVMAFPDYAFTGPKESFVSHRDVRHYLESYAAAFKLGKYIQLNTSVERVRRRDNGEWAVTARRLRTDAEATSSERTFDAVFVCNGHYCEPLMPTIGNAEAFAGRVLHSHDYRRPGDLAQCTAVACLGAGPSGTDIAIELANDDANRTVYLCSNDAPLPSVLPKNVEQKAGFERFTPGGVVTVGGEQLQLDAVVYCTGYKYSLPFLDESALRMRFGEHGVSPLYMHIVHTGHPRQLYFVGLCEKICPFPVFDAQVQFACALLTGKMATPSTETMLQCIREDEQLRKDVFCGSPRTHLMSDMQWQYMQQLSAMAGFEPPPAVVQALYNEVHGRRRANLVDYKSNVFELLDDDRFRCVA